MMKKIINIIKSNKRWCLLFFCVILFLYILEDVLDKDIIAVDTYLYHIVTLANNSKLTSFFKVITEFGDAIILITISVISLIILKNKKIGMAISLNLFTVALLNQVLKRIIQRPRPEGFRLIEESGYSFPSGHSMVSVAFYGLVIYLVFRYIKNKKAKILICTILSGLIILIGISRIYLGVHYASDVIAGFLISISYLIIYISIVLRLIGIEE